MDVQKVAFDVSAKTNPTETLVSNRSDFFQSLELKPRDSRYISVKLKHKIWCRDQGKCTKCSSTQNLNFDHIKPWALGGNTSSENLRLLCFHCNQRQRIEAKL